MRKRIWQLHSWLGLVAGLGLLVIGVTGSLLVFHEELELLFNPELVRVEPAPEGRLPMDDLLRAASWWGLVVDAFTPLHFGTFGGLPVKILWCLGGLAPGILATSGFAIWWLRRRRNRSKRGVVVRQLHRRELEMVTRR